MRNIFLITGPHGVGKSTLCHQMSIELGIPHLKASQLIFDYLQQNPPLRKSVSGASALERNQIALIMALKTHDISAAAILEGHTCLWDQRDHIEEIPFEIFKKVGVNGLVVVTRDLETVQTTLLQRDGISYCYEALEALQTRELFYSQFIAQKLVIPWMHLDFTQTPMDYAVKRTIHFITATCNFA